MGKGDRKTAKGKRNISSYGRSRPHSSAIKSGSAPQAPAAKKAATRKKA